MLNRHAFRIAIVVVGAVWAACGVARHCHGQDDSGGSTEVEIWLGSEKVNRPRLGRAAPTKPTTATTEAIPGTISPERRQAAAARSGEPGPARVPLKRLTTAPSEAASVPPPPSPPDPLGEAAPETPNLALQAEQVLQIRRLLLESMELTKQASSLLGSGGLDPQTGELGSVAPAAFSLDAGAIPSLLNARPSMNAVGPSDPELEPGKNEERSTRRNSAVQIPVAPALERAAESLWRWPAPRRAKQVVSDTQDEQEGRESQLRQEPQAEQEGSTATPPAVPEQESTSEPPCEPAVPAQDSLSTLTRPASLDISPLALRRHAANRTECDAPSTRDMSPVTQRQQPAPPAQQATALPLPNLKVTTIGIVVGLVSLGLVLLEFGGRLRGPLQAGRSRLWSLWRRTRGTPQSTKAAVADEPQDVEQALLASLVAHNVRLRSHFA